MTQIYASIATGTAAAMLAAILALLRTNFRGRRPFVALTRRWVAARPLTSRIISGLLVAIAIGCFSSIGVNDAREAHHSASAPGDVSTDPQALRSLRDYADTIGAQPRAEAETTPDPNPAELPAVDTMIAKLAKRLEQEPNDVKGWKMLGWSYLNMNRPEDAAKAYETALKLEPGNIEIKNGLAAANAAISAPSQTSLQISQQEQANAPAAAVTSVAEGQPDTDRNNMIRGMVDKLAARLATTPADEQGWLHLMRSRMTLGEEEAAKAALTKALETFVSDPAATERLTAAARELGVKFK